MRKFIQITISVLLLICMLLGISVRAVEQNAKPLTFQSQDTYQNVCVNGNTAMQYRPDIGAYRFCNSTTGEIIWNSVVCNEDYSLEEFAGKWLNYMQSVLCISYALKTDTSGTVMKDYSAAQTVGKSVQSVKNGISQKFAFSKIGITVTMNTILEKGGFSVTIPEDGVEETEKYALTSLEILPFFGSADAKQDGYLVYPDGNGGLTYFNSTEKRNENSAALVLDLYGTVSPDEIDDKNSNATACLPLMGIKRGTRAFAAAVTSGDSSAHISVNPNLDISPVELNYQYFNFDCRSSYKIFLSGIGSNTKELSSGWKLGKRIKTERSLRYFFLEESNADYSGMACAYRDWLIKNGTLTEFKNKGPRLSLEFFMGAENKDSLFGSIVAVTTFADVQKILEDYHKSEIDNIDVTLRGYASGGYGSSSISYRAARSFGGTKALKKLCSYVSSIKGMSIYLELSPVELQSERDTFSKKRTAVLMGNRTTLTDSEEEKYLVSPIKVSSVLKKAAKWVSELDGAKLSVRSIGTVLYEDYRSGKEASRADTMKLFSKARVQSVQGANLYTLSGVQRVYDVPFCEAYDSITDMQIPLVSMVLSGCVTMTADTGNRAFDFAELKLRWIEYGMTPVFELTEKSPVFLNKTDYNSLFSSQNSVWCDTVKEIYSDLQNRLSSVCGRSMVNHRYISEQVVCITYDNGSRVYLNFGETPTEIEGITLQKQDYVLLKGEE